MSKAKSQHPGQFSPYGEVNEPEYVLPLSTYKGRSTSWLLFSDVTEHEQRAETTADISAK